MMDQKEWSLPSAGPLSAATEQSSGGQIPAEKRYILSHIDHTLLKAQATWEEVKKLCEEAIRYGTASVCIPPSFVRRVKEAWPLLNVCTVVGFPLGYSVTAAKVCETKEAVGDGADEIDMVVNIGDVKSHSYDKVEEEIREVKNACGGHILKVIVEACYLTREEKVRLCRAVTDAGADYIKTSTGFGTGGATYEDVLLFSENIGPGVKIKAAGGIKTLEDMERFLEAGCERIGSSSAVGLFQAADK